MLNFNGQIVAKSVINLPISNRGFTYGDSLFDTCKLINSKIQFTEDHYFRLMASMRMLRMEIPMYFTLEFFEQEILKTASANKLDFEARVKFTVFRDSGGYYLPETNKISFIVEVSELKIPVSKSYEIAIFKDYYINSSLLSTLKTNNRILNVVASIFAAENNLDNCLLLNEKKNVVEALHGNIFLIKGNVVITPPLSDGCIKGVMRKKVIEMLQKDTSFTLEEAKISPFDLQKADSLFITNSIIGIKAVTKYRKKEFNLAIVNRIIKDFDLFIE